MPLPLSHRIAAGFKSFRYPAYLGGMGGGIAGMGGGWSNLTGGGRGLPGSTFDYRTQAGPLHQNGIVLACLNWMARVLPSALQVVYRPDPKTGEPAIVPNHPAIKFLQERNPYNSRHILQNQVVFDLATTGNAYVFKNASAAGKTAELINIPSWQLWPDWPADGSAYVSQYVYYVDGVRQPPIPKSKIVHIRHNFLNPAAIRLGLSPLSAVLREVFTDNEAATYSAAVLRNLGVPGVAISPKAKPLDDISFDEGFTEEQSNALARKWGESITGDNRGRTQVYDLPMDVHFLTGFSPEQMSMEALRNVPEERVCSALGVPAVVVGLGTGLESTTNNSVAEIFQRMAWYDCLIPTCLMIDDQMTAQLADDLPGWQEGDFLGRDLRKVAILQEAQDTQYARLTAAVGGPWLKPNEARAQIAVDPIEGGDVLYPPKSAAPGTGTAGAPPPPGGGNGSVASGTDDGDDEDAAPAKALALVARWRRVQAERRAMKSSLLPQFAFKGAGPHDYSSTQFDLPADLAKAVTDWSAENVSNDQTASGGRETNPHVTILYGLKTEDVTDVSSVVAGCGPVTLEFDGLDFFEAEGYDVLFVPVSDPEGTLRELRRKLSTLEHTSTHASYKPHVTVAYLQPGEGKKLAKGAGPLDGESATFDAFTFSDTFRDTATVELGKTATKAAASSDDGHWVTIDGAHVFINGSGEITKGPAGLVGKQTGGDLKENAGHKETVQATRKELAAKKKSGEMTDEQHKAADAPHKAHEAAIDKRGDHLAYPKTARPGMRPATAEEKKAVGAAPGWRGVQVADEMEGAKVKAIGLDSKSRYVYRRSAEYDAENAAAKFTRGQVFNDKTAEVVEQIKRDTKEPGAKGEAAAALSLIEKTGFRVGGEGDTGADKEAFGASTLKPEHVTIEGSKTVFAFPSKKGGFTRKTVDDADLAADMKARKEAVEASGSGRLFDTNQSKVLKYMKFVAGPDFKVKDFRTYHGGMKAREVMAKMPEPTTRAEFDKARNLVGEAVSEHLGNTPTVALKSYIDPAIFQDWESRVPAKKGTVKMYDYELPAQFKPDANGMMHYAAGWKEKAAKLLTEFYETTSYDEVPTDFMEKTNGTEDDGDE